MAVQIKGPMGALLVRMALANDKQSAEEPSLEKAPHPGNHEAVADYLERLIRATAHMVDEDGQPIMRMPQV